MKYIKYFEEIVIPVKSNDELNRFIDRLSNCDPSIPTNKSIVDSFFNNLLEKNFDVKAFYLKFFSNLRMNPDLINNKIFLETLFASEIIFGEFKSGKSGGSRKDNLYKYIPSNEVQFMNGLKFINKKIGPGYSFFDFGSGVPIKVLAAELLGFKSLGFEINKKLIQLSAELGISDLVQDKSIFYVGGLPSPKIIYYFNPIFDPKQMAIYENEVIKNMNKGDILFRVVLDSVNKFIGLTIPKVQNHKYSLGSFDKIDYTKLDPNSGLSKHLKTPPEISKLKMIYENQDLLQHYTIWIK